MMTAEHILVKAHIEAKTAWDNGATEDQMSQVLTLDKTCSVEMGLCCCQSWCKLPCSY
jgi:formate-dependent nitrite reductase cytochrome c552 subunit